MAQFYSRETLDFILFDVLDVQDLCKHELFADHNQEMFSMVLDSAHTFSENRLYPIHMEMDSDEPEIVDGTVQVHPEMKAITREFGEQGWILATASVEEGGQQLPMTIGWAASFIMGAANYSAVVFPGLTQGATELIRFFGSEEQKQTYLPPMFDGSWQGTMALTEPEAGSSLSDIKTTAYPQPDGTYRIKGQKIFISCGDHDACDNVVHLMLARIDGAPAGTKGISLFIVPKLRFNEDGALTENDVLLGGVYHKMGYRGAPIVHLMLGENDNCTGFLVGEEHKGLKYMFHMMNGARLSVGLHSASIASAAYYASLEYARERKQGRKIENKDMSLPQVPIIQHADVKRMLLFQKAIVEGSLSLLMQCSLYDDLSRSAPEADRGRYAMMADLLTPIIKAYPSEMGILTTSAAVQIHGGYGYTREYACEKYYREIRIHTLHEGTTAMQGMDLMGRKIAMKGGQAVMAIMQEVMTDLAASQSHEALKAHCALLTAKLEALQEVTMKLMGVAQKEGPEVFLADATLYLDLFSIIGVGWQWIKMNKVALDKLPSANEAEEAFLKGNLAAGAYFFEYEVPKTDALLTRLKSDQRITVETKEEYIL